MKTLFYSPGEPAGIGPDLFLSLLDEDFFRFIKAKVIFLGSKDLFSSRASELGYKFNINSDFFFILINIFNKYFLNIIIFNVSKY